MNNSSLKKRLLSVAMAAVMVFSLLPATAWAAMAENLPAASGQTRTEQKRGGSDTYTVTRDVKSVAAAQTGAVKKVTCLDLTTGENQVSLDANGGYRWVAGANHLYLYKVQIEADGSNALILPAGATVEVVGECSITGGGANECAVWSKGDVTVGLGQDAALTVNGLGWRAEGNLTVAHAYDAYTGGELTVNYYGTSSDNGTSGAAIYMGGNTLRVEQGARVTANGSGIGNVKAKDSCGVKGAVYVDGGAELVADGGSAGSAGISYGIFGDVTVKNGTVTATGGRGLQSYGVSGNSVSVSDGGVLNATGGTAVQDLNSSIKPISGGIYLGNNAVIENAAVNASGGVAPCGDSFASVGLQMTSRSEVTVNSGGVLNANGGQLTNGSSANETNGFSAGINMMDASEANLFVNGTGRVTAIGNPERLDGGTVISYGVNHTDMGELTIGLSGVASFKAAGGTAASRAAFTPDTVSIKGSEAYRDFDNVTDGYKFLNSTYVRNDVPAQSLVVTVCDHRAGVTNGKCNNCGAEVAAATVTDAAGVTTGYGTFEEAVNAAARLNGSTVRMLADAAVEANYTIAAGTFTIDFNGRKLTVAENNFFAAQTAEVTLTDSASIKVGQPCVPNAAEGGRIIVESGKFGGGIVQRDGGTLLLNGGYFGMITLMDPNENVMDLLGEGKAYRSVMGTDAWQDDSNADTTSVAGQKRLHEVEVVDAPLRIIQQTPASGTLTVYETSPAIPSLKVTAAYDSAMSWVFDAKLYYRASAIDGWSTADAPKVSSDGNGTVTVSSNTALKTGQYQLQLTFHGYRAESRVFNVTLEPCGHPDIDANGKCGTCQYQFVATLTDAAGEVTGYDTLNGALAEVKALSADAQNASRYTVRLHRDVTEDVRITGGKFTLDLNGHKAGDTAFTAGGSAAVILSGGEVSCNMQVRDTADLTVNGTVLRDVELYGSAKLTANGAAMGHLQTRDGTPAAVVTGGTISRITMQAGTVGLTGSVTVENQTEVLSGGVLTVTAQSGEPEFRNAVMVGDGGKLVASAGKFRSNVEFGIGAKGELSGGEYGGLECGGDQLLKDMLKTGYAYFGIEHLENGYVNSLMSQGYTVRPHSNHSYEWDTATHEKKCGCGDVSETDTAAPVIDFLNGAALKTENGRQVMDVTDNVIYTVTDANEVKVTVSYGSGTAAEVRPDAGGRYELPLSEGDGKPVTITAADEAGNVATVTFTLYRLVDMRISSHVGVAVEEADLTRAVRSGQTYTLRVTMLPGYTGEDGLELEQGALTTKQRFTGSDAAGYTVQVTADFNNSLLRIVGAYDNTPPTAEITIRNSSFRNFLNRISFGLFFKETQTVSVTAADVGAGLDKAEYLLSGTAFTKEADAGAADGWTALTLDTDGRGSFTVAPNSKGFLYVKAIDREGNVTVVNADGMVVYTDAEQITERVSFAEASADDCVFHVKDNGSTVRSITMGSRALVRDTEYRIGASANGQLAITLTNSFLTALTAGSYTLTVSYDPLGETYVSGGDNQAPASTTVVLTVGRSTVDADIASMDKIYDSEPVTPFANTESDGVMTWEFKPDGADPGAYTTAAPEDAGTYNVRLTVAETEHYDRIEKTGTFTISKKDIQLHTPALEDKTYDGSTAIVCMYYYPERAMVGKISGDDLSVVMGQAKADSPDVGRRTVTFTGFALAGSDAANYRLAAQPISGSAAITARPLSIGSLTVRDKLYDGLNTAAIEGTPTLVNLADGETLMLRCGTPTFDTVAAGDNIPVSFTEFTIADSANGKAGNYSLTQPAGITASIKAYTATGAEYTASTGQWTNQDFMVTAADGWQVSGTNTANGDWRGSLTRSDETGTGSLTFYVKNTADGYISESVTLTYKIDKTDPTGEIRIDQRNAWQSFWNTISFDLFYKSRQTVTMTAADEASGVTAIEYLLSEEDYTAAQLDGMTFQPYTAPVAITPNDRLIAYARITDAAGNVTYLRSDGVVLDAAAPVIAGVDDGAVYCGSVTFTVTDAYLDTVTVDGTAAVSAPGRAAGSTYIIEADSQLHTIVATDRAGNSTQVQITVNNGHTVGTPASCKAPAVCRYCGESFGDPAPGNHGGLLRRVDKVNATSTADGNIEYWYCSGCGKYYLDAAAGREITRGDTILPAIGLRIVGDVRVWRPGDKTLGVTFRQEYGDFTVQIDGVTVDPANYEVTADPDGGRLIVTFRAQFLRTLAFGERTITIVSDDGSASVSFRRDSARAVTSGGKAGVTSAATGDGFPMGGMAAALLVSGSALVMLTTRARRKEEE